MQLISQNIGKLNDLKNLILIIEDQDYNHPDEILSGSTVGQHIRHILEFYTSLSDGLATGEICYDDRKRDTRIEQDKSYAISVVNSICDFMDKANINTKLILKANYGEENKSIVQLASSVGREAAYCLDHMTHHLAILKIALVNRGYQLNENIGVAPSTIRYRKEICAQ